MVRFLMNRNRELLVTSSTVIHRGDTVGAIEFVIPIELEDTDITDLPLTIRYTLPNGDSYEEEIEDKDSEYKEGYIKYTLPLTKEITSISGSVEFDLRFENDDKENKIEIHCGVGRFNIEPNPNYYVTKINDDMP